MNNLLFVGKDLPESLEIAETFAKNDRIVFTNGKNPEDSDKFNSQSIFSYPSLWNRPSAASAKSFVINAETKLKNIDEVVFYFDAPDFSQKFSLDKIESITFAIENMISGYHFLLNELLIRLEQKKEPVIISFLVKKCISRFDLAISTYKNINSSATSSSLVFSAQEAFIALAKNTAALVNERPYLSFLIAEVSPAQNEFYQDDSLTADWLIKSMETIKNSKNKQSVKNAVNLNKAGTKISTGFSIFK